VIAPSITAEVTLSQQSSRGVMAEFPWIKRFFEWRKFRRCSKCAALTAADFPPLYCCAIQIVGRTSFGISSQCLQHGASCLMQEVKEFLGDYKAKNILISKKFKHGTVFYCCLWLDSDYKSRYCELVM